MGLFRKSNTFDDDADTLVPEVEWIPYRENGQVKYIRADDEEAENFTSTGGPAQARKYSAWANMTSGVGYMANAPQLLPERYTDDTLIPAIVTNIVPSMKPNPAETKSFLKKFTKAKDPTTRTVWMPRREYKKYFARDKDGNYIGTEPQREWTEEELQEEFGQYHKKL